MTAFTISVYQRKRDGQLEWTTLGLGPAGAARQGKSPTKLQRAMADDLRRHLAKSNPAALARFELVRGRRLRRVHFEITVRGEGKHAKASGLFPLVVEPRRRTMEETVTVAYHPLRQDDWFVVADDVPLDVQARRFFSHVWRELPQAFVKEQLATDGRDVLRAFSFSERGPQLVDELPPDEDDVWADLEIEGNRERGARKRRRKKAWGRAALRAVAENVTARVADRLVPLGRPREPWRTQLLQLVGGPRKSPVVLIGPPGVGKTTVLHRCVADLLEADDFAAHRNLDRVQEVWRTSARRMMAGMSYVGDWEKRCVDLASEAADPRVIVWMEDLAAFGRAGRTRDSDRTLADFFRGPVSRGEVTLVGEATETQWHRLTEDAPSFADRFTVLRITPTPAVETLTLMLHEVRELEGLHRIRFAPDAYRAIVQLGEALRPGSAQPGTAVDLLRQLAADVAFDRRLSEGEDEPDPVVDGDAAVRLLARRTGLPVSLLRSDAPLSSDALAARFAEHVLGQDAALQAAVDVVARIRAGLTDRERPFATYLFTGPTGTGKTQMAKTIAGFLYGDESRLVRVDMGEMSGPDAVARLIGDRWDPHGLLTDAIRQQPFSVVLFDEIEKAHPAVLQLLLQLLDEGRLSDAAGELADFRQSVVVMTSNLGAKPRAAVGFGESADAILHDVDRAVREFFPPELFNRIDRVVPFSPLTPEIAELVTEKELAQLLARRGLTDRRVFVFAHPEAVKRMAATAFDPRDGARSVKRHLESEIGSLLANELAKGSCAQMRIVRVYGGGVGGYRLHVDELKEAEPLGARFELEALIDQPASVLVTHLPRLLRRVLRLEESPDLQRVRARISELVEQVGRGEAAVERSLYFLDAFRESVRVLREELERHASPSADVDRELAHDARRPAPDLGLGHRTVRILHHRAMKPGVAAFSADRIRAGFGEVALLERALARLEDPAEHRVYLELVRVGQGRRPPAYERAREGLLEHLARLYAGLRGELFDAAIEAEDGGIHHAVEPVDLGALLTHRARAIVLGIDGVAVRSFFEGETGCHVWSSLLAGASIVRVRALEATHASSREALEERAAAVIAFDAALERADERLPPDPAGLLPVVRQVRFDPPRRPGESALMELEDYATGHVVVRHATELRQVLAPMVWLRASRAEDPEAAS